MKVRNNIQLLKWNIISGKIIVYSFTMEQLSPNNGNGLRRTYSIRVPSAGTISFGSFINLSTDNDIESQDQNWDPLPILIPITDIVLIMTAVIFVIALGIVGLIVTIAIRKLYFLEDNQHRSDIWTLFWQLQLIKRLIYHNIFVLNIMNLCFDVLF